MSPKINIRTPEWKWLWNVTNDVTMSHSCNRIGRNGNVLSLLSLPTFATINVKIIKRKRVSDESGSIFWSTSVFLESKLCECLTWLVTKVLLIHQTIFPQNVFQKSHFDLLSNFSGESFWSNFEKKNFFQNESKWLLFRHFESGSKWLHTEWLIFEVDKSDFSQQTKMDQNINPLFYFPRIIA